MECEECNSNSGELVEVEYTDDATETLALCEDCRAEFTDAELINGVGTVENE